MTAPPNLNWYLRHASTCALQAVRDNHPADPLCTCGLREAYLAASATDEGPRDDGAFTRLLRRYADRARDNETDRTMVPKVVLRDAAAVIDDYRSARPPVPALDARYVAAALEQTSNDYTEAVVRDDIEPWLTAGRFSWFKYAEHFLAVLSEKQP